MGNLVEKEMDQGERTSEVTRHIEGCLSTESTC